MDDRKQEVVNRRVSEDIVLDIGEDDKIAGIEILDTTRHVALERLLPIQYKASSYWLFSEVRERLTGVSF